MGRSHKRKLVSGKNLQKGEWFEQGLLKNIQTTSNHMQVMFVWAGVCKPYVNQKSKDLPYSNAVLVLTCISGGILMTKSANKYLLEVNN